MNPPTTKAELFRRLQGLLHGGWYTIPNEGYGGTGGPGRFLEDLLGLKAGNQDISDSVGWEVKYYTKQTRLITLFHKSPTPTQIMRHLVRRFGDKDNHGRMRLQHTIKGKSSFFRVVEDAEQLIVRPLKGNGPVPIWTHDDLLSIAGGKLRRLVLVKGTRKGQKIRFIRADCYEKLHLENFIYEVLRGTIHIDFDAREMKPGSAGLRDHGTKFRVSPQDVCRLYTKKDRFT